MVQGNYMPTSIDFTCGADIAFEGENIDVRWWDTAGHEDYDRLRPLTYFETDLFLILFAIHSLDGFEHVTTKVSIIHTPPVPTKFGSFQRQWLPEVRFHCGEDIPCILVGARADLRSFDGVNPKPLVSPERAMRVAKENRMPYIECSSTANWGVDEVVNLALATLTSRSRGRSDPQGCIVC